MQNKDKGDEIEESPLDMLLVILLEGASKEVVWLVTPSSTSHLSRHVNVCRSIPNLDMDMNLY